MTDEDNSDDFKLDPPYRQAVEDCVHQFHFGDLIEHEWLRQAFEIDFPEKGTRAQFEAMQFAFLEAMDGFRQYLLEHYRMALQNVRGRGYRIVPPHEQTAYAMSELRRQVASDYRKAVMTLSYVQTELLNEAQRQENIEARGKLAAVQAFTKQRLPG